MVGYLQLKRVLLLSLSPIFVLFKNFSTCVFFFESWFKWIVKRLYSELCDQSVVLNFLFRTKTSMFVFFNTDSIMGWCTYCVKYLCNDAEKLNIF